MEGLFTPVRTSKTPKQDEFILEVSKRKAPVSQPKPDLAHASTPEEALEILKNEPTHDALLETLKFISKRTSKFDIHAPGSSVSQLIQVLVSEIVPTFWDVLSETSKNERRSNKKLKQGDGNVGLLLYCLESVPGLSAIILNLKQLTQLIKSKQKQIGGRNSVEASLTSMLQAVATLLEGDNSIHNIWKSTTQTAGSDASRKALWSETLSLLGSKIVGVVAEAEIMLGSVVKDSDVKTWIADGDLYARWVAQNVCFWVKNTGKDDQERKAIGDLLSRSFRLGHTDSIIEEVLQGLLLHSEASPRHTLQLLDNIPSYEQRNFLLSAFKMIAKKFLSSETVTVANTQWWLADKEIVTAASRLVATLIAGQEERRNHVITWLTSTSGAGVGEGIALRRAVITAIVADKKDAENVLEKSLQQFGDQLYIKHVPSMQQEAHAQVLLLVAGHVRRDSPIRFKMMMRAGGHLNVVSNRLGTSSSRARFLGMVIAEALSSLVDEGDKRMDFKMDETKTPEALWYKSLVSVNDQMGSLELLQIPKLAQATQQIPHQRVSPDVAAHRYTSTKLQSSKIIAIEEVSDNDADASNSGEDDLAPYARPDSDAEDSDEDPTTIVRNKPTAPVYIRDLILYLRESDNYDKQKLGLQIAASLIRRKANFGTEVSEHAEDLATLLVGIQDKYEIEDFEGFRLQGMIALVVAQPSKMGQWFSKTFFDGDYSISQRASILTTLGLSARELGGYGTADTSLPALGTTFPSKSLPEAAHKRFAPVPSSSSSALKPIDSLAQQLQTTYLAPLATSIADKYSGPDVLKLKTFSSRIKSQPRPPVKVITNILAQTISSSFFFPLTGRFFVHLKAYGSSKSSNIIFQPHLLSHFLKTLAVLVHASGTSTLALPQVTSEFWDLLLSLRAQAVGDVAVLEALLFALLTLLEINENQRGLVEENGGRLLETQSWVEGVFSRLSGEGEEEASVKMCAAGVLIRIREIVEKYQALLLGDMYLAYQLGASLPSLAGHNDP